MKNITLKEANITPKYQIGQIVQTIDLGTLYLVYDIGVDKNHNQIYEARYSLRAVGYENKVKGLIKLNESRVNPYNETIFKNDRQSALRYKINNHFKIEDKALIDYYFENDFYSPSMLTEEWTNKIHREQIKTEHTLNEILTILEDNFHNDFIMENLIRVITTNEFIEIEDKESFFETYCSIEKKHTNRFRNITADELYRKCLDNYCAIIPNTPSHILIDYKQLKQNDIIEYHANNGQPSSDDLFDIFLGLIKGDANLHQATIDKINQELATRNDELSKLASLI